MNNSVGSLYYNGFTWTQEVQSILVPIALFQVPSFHARLFKLFLYIYTIGCLA
jgi:hypothetical protein